MSVSCPVGELSCSRFRMKNSIKQINIVYMMYKMNNMYAHVMEMVAAGSNKDHIPHRCTCISKTFKGLYLKPTISLMLV